MPNPNEKPDMPIAHWPESCKNYEGSYCGNPCVLQACAEWISSLKVYSLIDTKCYSQEWDLVATLRALGALS
jgi:hypothetical protein